MISVVIPLYNKEQQIGYTLQSVLHQTFQQFEIVIVDDGSTDGSVAEVEKIHDDRIRLIHQKNAGVSAARNRGIAEAKYDLIAFLDADDEWKSGYLETQYGLYQKYPECSVYACNYEFRNADGKVMPTIIHKLPFGEGDGILTNYFEVASCSHPPICSISIMVRKNAIKAIGGFPVGIKSGEDLLTWARLAVRYKIAFSCQIQAVFINDTKLFNTDQKKREPEKNDVVGSDLKRLYQQNPMIPGLKTYNALWHKMRAHIFIDKGFHKKALSECFQSMQFQISLKIIAFSVLALLPRKISHYFFNKLS